MGEREEATEFADRVIPLLREFSKKYRELRAEARAIRNEVRVLAEHHGANAAAVFTAKNEFYAIQNRVNSLQPASLEMVQKTIQVIRHGDLSDARQLELSVRLADFQSEMQHTVAVVNGPIDP